jgi:hypothetical protein
VYAATASKPAIPAINANREVLGVVCFSGCTAVVASILPDGPAIACFATERRSGGDRIEPIGR